jgi:hypothetical protein
MNWSMSFHCQVLLRYNRRVWMLRLIIIPIQAFRDSPLNNNQNKYLISQTSTPWAGVMNPRPALLPSTGRNISRGWWSLRSTEGQPCSSRCPGCCRHTGDHCRFTAWHSRKHLYSCQQYSVMQVQDIRIRVDAKDKDLYHPCKASFIRLRRPSAGWDDCRDNNAKNVVTTIGIWKSSAQRRNVILQNRPFSRLWHEIMRINREQTTEPMKFFQHKKSWHVRPIEWFESRYQSSGRL